MNPNFERDEATGLWKWPVLLSDDWSKWTPKPCVVLVGRLPHHYFSLKLIAALDVWSRWPQLQQFQIGHTNLLVLAQSYSQGQALLLAEDVNRQLREVELPPSFYRPSGERGMTWGIAVPHDEHWDLSDALSEVFALAQRAEEEKRFGSINIAEEDWQHHSHEALAVCAQRDGLTTLWSWQSVAAMRLNLDGEQLTLLMGDVDRFKTFNDTFGHGAADVPLQSIGDILRGMESVDVAAFRLGGDEFVILIRGFSLERAREMAEQVNRELRETTSSVDNPAKAFGGLSLTWGVVSSVHGPFDAMLRQADDLIHFAKAANRRGTVNS